MTFILVGMVVLAVATIGLSVYTLYSILRSRP